MWRIILGAVILAAGLAAFSPTIWTGLMPGNARASAPDAPGFRMAAISRGDLVLGVSSTGTLRPVATIQLGTQVSGQISEMLADYNQTVTQGQVVARIDPVGFRIARDQAQAELEIAQASVEGQIAAIRRAEAALQTAGHEHRAAQGNAAAARRRAQAAAADLGRKQALQRSISAAELDHALTERDALAGLQQSAEAVEAAQHSRIAQSAAELEQARSQLLNMRAVVRQREAALRHTELELDRTEIRSPVDGVVIQRDVEVGQTVAASLQSPTLVVIARDLSEMEVYAAVDESEIGLIQPGQRVDFTVDAYRDRLFSGEVVQIRKSPQTSQNVVTYTVVIKAENVDLTLLPGMTASVRFLTSEIRDRLIVPQAALRFDPSGAGGNPGDRVWILSDGVPRAVPVAVLLGDDLSAAIQADGLSEGQQVLVGIERQTEQVSRLLFGSGS